jgi:hypothetical protein
METTVKRLLKINKTWKASQAMRYRTLLVFILGIGARHMFNRRRGRSNNRLVSGLLGNNTKPRSGYTLKDMNDPNTPIVIPYELTERQRVLLLKH